MASGAPLAPEAVPREHDPFLAGEAVPRQGNSEAVPRCCHSTTPRPFDTYPKRGWEGGPMDVVLHEVVRRNVGMPIMVFTTHAAQHP